jgi:hypothetical protein
MSCNVLLHDSTFDTKPEEHGRMPQRRHSPRAKHRGDRNSEYHEEHEKDVVRILAAHPLKTWEMEHE